MPALASMHAHATNLSRLHLAGHRDHVGLYVCNIMHNLILDHYIYGALHNFVPPFLSFVLPPPKAVSLSRDNAMSKLYVGNLSDSANEKDLRELFQAFGEVEEVAVLRGYGFVVSERRAFTVLVCWAP